MRRVTLAQIDAVQRREAESITYGLEVLKSEVEHNDKLSCVGVIRRVVFGVLTERAVQYLMMETLMSLVTIKSCHSGAI